MERKGCKQEPNTSNPLAHARGEPVNWCAPGSTASADKEHISSWSCVLSLNARDNIQLFGCMEDVYCVGAAGEQTHAKEIACAPYVKHLCTECQIPVCLRCRKGLHAYQGISSIPMSLANDHYYGYVHRYIVETEVTWLECAAASVCWSTMLVFYLEEPHGHLMNEVMAGCQGSGTCVAARSPQLPNPIKSRREHKVRKIEAGGGG